MPATLVNQIQIRKSRTYNDSVTPSEANFETNTTTLADDVDNLTSAINNIKGSGNWYDNLDNATPSARDITTLGGDLDSVETKTFLFRNQILGDITVANGENWVVLGLGEIPTTSPFDIAALNASTEGSVTVQATSFDANSLDAVAGANALNPKNLVIVRDATTFDSITSGGREVYGLFQTEQNVDGDTISTTSGVGTTRVQISFVRSNAGGTALEACPVADIEDAVINYSHVVRLEYNNIPEQAFLTGLFVDQTAASDVNLTNAIANQVGEAPQTQNIDVAVSAGNSWDFLAGAGGDSIANFANSGGVATLTLGSAGTAATTIAGTTLDINVTDDVTIASGLVVEDGGNQDLRLGGVAGAGTLDTASGSLTLNGAAGATLSTTAGGVSVTSAAAIDMDGVGNVAINSSTGTINIGNDAVAQSIGIGTGAAARTITIGNATGATAVNFDAGTGNYSFDSTAADTAALLTLTNTGTGGDSVGLFTGSSSPDGRVTGDIGSLFMDGTNGALWINVDGATDWSQFDTAGATTLSQAVNAQAGTAFTAGAFDTQWGLTDGQSLEIGDSSNAGILTVSAAAAGDSVTIDLAETATGATFAVTDGTNNLLTINSDTGGDTLAMANLASMTADTTGAISLDSGAASNFTVTGGGLTLSTVTSGAVAISAADGVTVNAGSDTIGNNIAVVAGEGTSGAGGILSLTSGSSTGGNGNGGDIFLTSGLGDGIGGGGNIVLNTSNDGNVLNEGASITMQGAGGIGREGTITIEPGIQSSDGADLVLQTQAGATGSGGDITLTSADAGAGGSGNAGNISITTGDSSSSATSAPGDFLVTTGDGTSFSEQDGGNVTFSLGSGGPDNTGPDPGAGGNFQVIAGSGGAGDGTSTSGIGGSVSLFAGSATAGNSNGGPANLNSGSGFGSGGGGLLSFSAGSGGATGTGGAVVMSAGAGGATSGAGGAFTINSGSATAGNSNGGGVSVGAGSATGTGTGGSLFLTSGASDVGNGDAGDIFVTAANGNDNAGRVFITGGNSAGGGHGYTVIQLGTGAAPGGTPDDGDQVLRLLNAGTNGGQADVFMTDRTPVGNILGNPGSVAIREDGVNSVMYMHTGASANSTDWTAFALGDSTLEAAWASNTGVATTLQNSFTGNVSDTETYLIQSATGNHNLLSLAAVSGADVITIGHANEASVVDIDSGTGGTAIDSTGAVSIDAAAASNFTVDGADLTLSTSTSGSVAISTASAADASGNDITLTAGDSSGAANAGGSVVLEGGAPGAGGAPGNVTIQSAASANVDEEDALLTLSNQGTGTGGGSSISQFVIEGDPTSVSIPANVGSVAFRNGSGLGTVGQMWVKAGAADTAWERVATVESLTWAQVLSNGNTSGGADVVMSSGDILRGVDTTLGTDLVMRGGASSTAGNDGGDVTITGGASSAVTGAGAGGSVSITGATPSSATGTGGAVTITSGDGGTGVGNADGGDISISAGDADTSGVGGNISITAGNSFGGGNDGGDITLTTGTSAAAAAGAVTITGPNDEDEAILTLTTTGTGGDSVNMFVGDSDPDGSVTGLAGSLFFRDTAGSAELYLNTSNGSGTTWTQVDVGGVGASLQASYEAGNTIVTDAGNGDLDVSGTEAISLDAGAASNFTVAGANLTLATTTSGTVALDSAGTLTAESDGAMTLSTTAQSAAGAMTLSVGNSTGGAGADLSLTAGGSTSAAGAGGDMNVTGGAGGSNAVGGNVVITGGAGGFTSGNAGNVSILGGTPTDGDGGDITLTASAGVGTNQDGGSVTLVPGAPTGSGANGVVTVDSALANTAAVLRLDNSDGGSGSTFDMFGSTAQPESTITADPGDIAFVNNGGTGELWIKTSGSATNTGWEQIATGAQASRTFFQDTFSSAVNAGNDVTDSDLTGGSMPSKPSGLSFDTEAEVYINGVLQFNGSGNDVQDAAGDDINLVNASASIGDVLTIVYYADI